VSHRSPSLCGGHGSRHFGDHLPAVGYEHWPSAPDLPKVSTELRLERANAYLGHGRL
jgi:hypothetical protein